MKTELAQDVHQATLIALNKVGSQRFKTEGADAFINLTRLINEFKKTTILDKIQAALDLAKEPESTLSFLAVMDEVVPEMEPEHVRRIALAGNDAVYDYYKEFFEDNQGSQDESPDDDEFDNY